MKRGSCLAFFCDRKEQMENWKDITYFEDVYEVSDMGNVRRKGSDKNLKPDGRDYPTVDLSKNGQHKRYAIHRLVALHFVPNPSPKEKLEVNHIDGDKKNNRADNLEWVSSAENIQHCWASLGRGKPPRPVEKLDLNTGEVLQRYKSVSEASYEFGSQSARAGITRCCQGHYEKAYGYKWRYAD